LPSSYVPSRQPAVSLGTLAKRSLNTLNINPPHSVLIVYSIVQDKPPRPECAPHWHERLLKHLPDLQLTLLVGQYAHRHYLGTERKDSMTENVKAFSQHGPQFFPLPHPSWRSVIWMRKHPWFEETIIPRLRKAVRKLV
jgi:uracil-DNA glycosylase